MRNIVLQDYYSYYIEDLDQVEAFDFEEFSLTLYILTKQKVLYVIKIQENLQKHTLQNKIDLSDQIPSIEVVLGIKYILELESVIIVQKSGELFKYNTQSKDGESVGCIENGILGFSYSPNQDLLVIATGNNTLLTLDNNFDIKNEVPTDDDNQQLQYDANDYVVVYFSWKADAKFFVCNYPLKSGRKCLTRSADLEVFKSAAKPDPEGGIVQSVAEQEVQNLRGPICWQPTGNLIAGYDYQKNKTRVIFWEKNGLRHGEFILPEEIIKNNNQQGEILIKNILYNKDSEILALELDCQILLYHRSNYKWHLKKIIYSNKNKKIVGIQFCVQSSKKLIVVYEDQIIEIFDLQMAYSQGLIDNINSNSLCLTVSVDGSLLLVTSLKKNVMPPPMSNFQFNLKKAVISFSVGKDYVCGVTEDGLYLFQIDQQLQVKEQFIKNDAYYQKGDRLRQFQYFECKNYNSVFFLSGNQQEQKITELIICQKNFSVQKTIQKNINQQILCSCPSGAYFQQQQNKQGDEDSESHNNDFIYLSNSQGQVFQYQLNNQNSQLKKHSQFDLPPIKIQAITHEYEEILFGLSFNHRLMISNSKIISTQATSFCLYGSYLLYTQNTSGMYQSLYVFDLQDPNNPITNSSQVIPGTDSKSLNVRNIERGSTIVSLRNDSLVFQLPRGNLELINCRVIYLRKVRELISQNKYNEAFEICRTNKLDLNLIFDIDQNKFKNQAQEILKSFKKTEYINLLIADIKPNLSEELQYSIYDNEYQQSKNVHISFLNKKVNIFCDTIIKALEAIGDQKFLYSKMTAHIKKEPTELEYVLSEIKKMKDSEVNKPQEHHPPHLNPQTNKKFEAVKKVTSRSLLEFVCWLANADRIYDISLGTYDLELVAMAAQFTQKDPKEYIPYLEKLKKIEDLVERKYVINMDLKRYDKAVLELSQGNEKQKEVALQLIKKHNLFNVGLKAFAKNDELTKKIKIFMGDYLADKKEFQQALLAYESVGGFEEGLQVCINAGNVKKAVFFAKKLGKNTEEVVQQIIQQLVSNGQHSQAGKAYKKIEQYEKAIEYFVKGNDWQQSTDCLMRVHNNFEYLKFNVIIPALSLQCNLKCNLLRELRNQFLSKFARLKVIQEEKRLRPQLMQNIGLGQFGQTEQDMISDISESTNKTNATHTSYTISQTTGMKKKKDKKPKNLLKRNVKEGSPVEEEYIVEFLQDIQQRLDIFSDVKNLIQYLIYYDLLGEAGELNKEMKAFGEEINTKVKSLKQSVFEEQNPQLYEIYPHIKEFDKNNMKAFDVFLSNFDHVL